MQRTTSLLRVPFARRSFATAARVPPSYYARPAACAFLKPVHAVRIEKRFLTQGGWKNNKDITYDELKPITQQPSDDVLLIDVREPDEVMMGSIPSSVNIPLSNFEKALELDGGDFTKAYGFNKPSKNQKIIFYCKAGKRSNTATTLAKGKGYSQVRNYGGSFDDWTAKKAKDSH